MIISLLKVIKKDLRVASVGMCIAKCSIYSTRILANGFKHGCISSVESVEVCPDPDTFCTRTLSKPVNQCFWWWPSAEWHVHFAFCLGLGGSSS